jgi:hypothetical protein
LGKTEASAETQANDLRGRPQENRSRSACTLVKGKGEAEEGGVTRSMGYR